MLDIKKLQKIEMESVPTVQLIDEDRGFGHKLILTQI